jgi:cysteinyl-tRNA synthetase
MHNGMVEARGGEKMSKSLGNVLLLSDLFLEADPRAYRLLVLRSHYRAPIEVTPGTLADAESALGRLDALSGRLSEAGESGTEKPDAEVTAAFVERMQDDLDTPRATAVLFEAIRRANLAFDAREGAKAAALARAVVECFAAVGLRAKGVAEVPGDVLELGRLRDRAREGRDFAAADRLRAEIVALGFVVEDTPGGTRIRR